MSSQITKEDLLNFTHQLHCQLRSSKGIKLTGLPALNEIENILFFRFIEEIKDITGIPDEYKFTTICEKYATDEKRNENKKIPYLGDRNCFKLWCEFYDITDKNCVLFKYLGNQQIKKYIKSSISKVSAFVEKKEACQTIQILFNMVYNKFKNITFDSKFYDMFGAAHEEFKTNEHGNGGKHTGQHFTPMDIKKLVVEELDIKSNEIYYEPCAGTGGFIHTFDKYIREKEGDEKAKKFKSNIYANECNPEMIKPLMINMLLHNIPVDNIHEEDSLSYSNIVEMKNKVDVIGTNYPFGMSNTIDLNDYHEEKNYWGCLIKGKNVIKNSSGQFIIHIYNSLKDGGRAGFVSDRGIIFNGDDKSWEATLRKFLMDNTNLYKIWLLPTGVFPYTSFATCVIFIKKGEKTKQVKIYEGKFKDDKKKTGLYIEKEPLKIFDRKELKANGYSLKLEEKKEELKKGWVKLGDVIELQPKSKHKASEATDDGKYNFYTSSVQIKKSNYNDYIDECIVIGSGGNGSLFIDKNFSCSADNFIFKPINVNLKYIYYYLKINFNTLYELYKGGGLKHLSQVDLKDFQIPSISLEHQEEIVKFLDEQFELYDINQLTKGIKDIQLFDLLLNKNYDLFADVLHLIYRKMELDVLQKQMEKDKKAVFNLSLSNMNTKEYKLGDIVEFNIGGTPSTKNSDYWDGEYNWCSISDLNGSYIENTEKKITKKGIENSSVKLIEKNSIMVSFKLSIGKVGIAKKDMYCNEAIMFFKHENESTNKYLMYYFNYINFSKGLTGGCIGTGSLNKDILKNLIIPIQSMKEQEVLVKQIESIEKDQKTHLEYAKIIQSKIDMIENIINKQNKISLDEKDNEKNNEKDNDKYDEDSSKIVKRTKSTKSSKSSESSKSTKSSKKIIKEETYDEEEIIDEEDIIEEKHKVKKNK